MGRGGGSLEELWAFNTEEVARAIFHSRIPVVSAVGHETDYTISDLVADLRAPTPSAAAEMVVPCQAELEESVRQLQERIMRAVLQKRQTARDGVRAYSGRNLGIMLKRIASIHQQEVGLQSLRLLQRMRTVSDKASQDLQSLTGKLEALSPLQVMERGYSMCLEAQSGDLIQDSSTVKLGDQVNVMLRKGSLECEVRETKEETVWKNGKSEMLP